MILVNTSSVISIAVLRDCISSSSFIAAKFSTIELVDIQFILGKLEIIVS